MECSREENLKDCACTYPGCARKGLCCQCVRYHREKGELPGCFFGSVAEKEYDRSIKRYLEDKK